MREGDTPLIDAARHGRAADVVALLADGADVNERNQKGANCCTWPAMRATPRSPRSCPLRTPTWIRPTLAGRRTRRLHEGLHRDRRKLLAANAEVNQATNNVGTPLSIACHVGRTEIVKKLIAANANMNQASNATGVTPLYAACWMGRTEVVAELLAANADVNQARNDGATPLYIASERGHTEIVAKLLAAKANVDQANNHGTTPMATACCFGHLGVVQLLSSYGASRTFPFNPPNDTAEGLATRRGHHDLVAWLSAPASGTALHHLEFLPERALARAVEPTSTPPHGPAGRRRSARANWRRRAVNRHGGVPRPRGGEAVEPPDAQVLPGGARARAAALCRGFRFSGRFPREEQAMYDVWMTIVMGQAVTRNYGRFGLTPIGNPDFNHSCELRLRRTVRTRRRRARPRRCRRLPLPPMPPTPRE